VTRRLNGAARLDERRKERLQLLVQRQMVNVHKAVHPERHLVTEVRWLTGAFCKPDRLIAVLPGRQSPEHIQPVEPVEPVGVEPSRARGHCQTGH